MAISPQTYYEQRTRIILTRRPDGQKPVDTHDPRYHPISGFHRLLLTCRSHSTPTPHLPAPPQSPQPRRQTPHSLLYHLISPNLSYPKRLILVRKHPSIRWRKRSGGEGCQLLRDVRTAEEIEIEVVLIVPEGSLDFRADGGEGL